MAQVCTNTSTKAVFSHLHHAPHSIPSPARILCCHLCSLLMVTIATLSFPVVCLDLSLKDATPGPLDQGTWYISSALLPKTHSYPFWTSCLSHWHSPPPQSQQFNMWVSLPMSFHLHRKYLILPLKTHVSSLSISLPMPGGPSSFSWSSMCFKSALFPLCLQFPPLCNSVSLALAKQLELKIKSYHFC